MFATVQKIEMSLAEVLSGYSPSAIDRAELKDLLEAFSHLERLASAAVAATSFELTCNHGLLEPGDRSDAHSLARMEKISLSRAKEIIDTGKSLAKHPLLTRHALSGEFSASQLNLVSDAIGVNPLMERNLIEKAAGGSLDELKEHCTKAKALATDPDERRRAIHRRRYLKTYTDTDGMRHLRAGANPEELAFLETAIEDKRRHIFEDARRKGTREPYEAYGFDAMIQMFADVCGGGGHTSAGAGGSATTSASGISSGGGGHTSAGANDGPTGGGGVGDAGGGALAAVDIAFGERQAPASVPAGAGGSATTSASGISSGGGGHTSAGANDGPTGGGGVGDAGGGALAAVDIAFGERQAPASVPAGSAGLAALAVGDPTPTTNTTSTPRTKIIVRVDHAALIRGHAITGEVSEIAGIGPIAPSAVIDMIESGDPFLAAVVAKGEKVTSVVHLGRRPNAKQQTALQWLYPACAVKGCSSTTYLEMDHRKPWANTRITVLSLLDRLCSYHHALKTRENWSLVAGHGKRAFVPPEDPRHPSRQKEKKTRTGELSKVLVREASTSRKC
ncbi:MAG: hypothetical protein M1350_03825 [Actinobacteria bacterium]|nr:hypothetical protein [Actinomycetota bacterium]